jgi:hypothetical protein
MRRWRDIFEDLKQIVKKCGVSKPTQKSIIGLKIMALGI